MDPTVIDDLIRRLEGLGLVGLSQESGIKVWKDFCVVEELMELSARCDLISYDHSERLAFLLCAYNLRNRDAVRL